MNTFKKLLALAFILSFFSCKNENSETSIEDSALEEQLAKFESLGMDTKHNAVFEPLKIGEQAPDFEGTDQYGIKHDLASLTKDSSLVMIFYRGQWCPLCSRYLTKFAEELDTLRSLGARVVAVTPEIQESVESMMGQTGFTLPIISDLDRSIMDAFKVSFRVNETYQEKIRTALNTDIAENNGSDDAFLPIPATYIIDINQKIKFVHYDTNYRSRASIQNIARNL